MVGGSTCVSEYFIFSPPQTKINASSNHHRRIVTRQSPSLPLPLPSLPFYPIHRLGYCKIRFLIGLAGENPYIIFPYLFSAQSIGRDAGTNQCRWEFQKEEKGFEKWYIKRNNNCTSCNAAGNRIGNN